jgi:hypothetical protein
MLLAGKGLGAAARPVVVAREGSAREERFREKGNGLRNKGGDEPRPEARKDDLAKVRPVVAGSRLGKKRAREWSGENPSPKAKHGRKKIGKTIRCDWFPGIYFKFHHFKFFDAD